MSAEILSIIAAARDATSLAASGLRLLAQRAQLGPAFVEAQTAFVAKRAALTGTPSTVIDHSARIVHCTREEYDALARVNWSTVKHIGRSPAHYQEALRNRAKDTDARKLGRASHVATLEPERFAAEHVTWEGGRRQGNDWKAFAARHAAVEILTRDEAAECFALRDAVRGNRVAMRHIARGEAEASVLWTHTVPTTDDAPATLIDCRCRLDFLGDESLVDLKTTRDASPEGFGREVWRYRYHTQAALYSDAVEAATGERRPFVLIAVESDAPHVVQVYRIPDVVMEAGREEYRALFAKLAECRRSGKWPGYLDEESELTMPRWAAGFDQDEDVSDLGLVIGGSVDP